jgi:amino acid adenylation domain-containing protein
MHDLQDLRLRPLDSSWPVSDLGELVRESAARHADRPALWVDGAAISYRELLGQAASLAGVLPGRGEGEPPRRCAILGARSLSAFAGVLGAVLARSAYVPLNPRHPPERLAATMRAAEPDALVLDERAATVAPELLALVERPLQVVMPEAASVPDWARGLPRHRFLCRGDLGPAPAPKAGVRGDPQDVAYLLFTSGSTGEPKGVPVSHRNVTSYLRSVAGRYAPQPEDRFSQLFDLTFDLSVHDMFLCWGAGAALFCPPESAKMAPREFVRRHELTFWFSTPSTAAFMARARMLRPGDLPSLRWSLFCGEALPRRLAQAFAAAAPNSVVENLYGPTETTIAITVYRLPADPAALERLPEVVPIGAPLPGQAAVVLDAEGRRAPPGAEGELCLGGPQVTGGYWRRPDLTAARFAPPLDELEGGCGGRWYRTGDRARLDPEHGLEFLGRLDRQVKIAGHRVELQAVEAALREAAGCDSVAAIAWPVDNDGLARGIVAFVAAESAPDEAVLAACRRMLPPYMTPSRLLRLAEWPLNSNGKTDYPRLSRVMEAEP